VRGLNTTVTVRRLNPSTEAWAGAYSGLPFRIEDLREVERYDPQYRGTTLYTHLGFSPFKWKNSAVILKVKDEVTDDVSGAEYRLGATVDAAGARHHLEVMLKRIDKE